MKLALIRHTAVAADGICYGRREVPLADGFPEQADAVMAALPFSPGHVVSSPSARCIRLATALAPTWTTDRRWLEMHFGHWEGIPWSRIPRHALDAWARDTVDFEIPGGESYRQLVHRVRDALDDIERLECPSVAVITHGGPIRAALAILAPRDPADTLSVSVPFGSIHTASL